MALKLAEKGIYYYPAIHNDKGGLKGSHGFRDAVNDDSMAREWFWGNNNNIGINLKKSRLIIFDVDLNHKNGVNGKHSLAKVFNEYGRLPNDTLIEKTPHGGLHYFLKLPEGVRPKNKISAFFEDSGIDLMTTNILIAPSSIDGTCYTNVSNSYDDIKMAPGWLIDYMTKRSNKVQGSSNFTGYKKYTGRLIDSIVKGADQGQRNDFITKIAGSLIAVGTNPQSAYELLLVINQNFVNPPLPTNEIDNIYNSIVTRELQRLKVK